MVMASLSFFARGAVGSMFKHMGQSAARRHPWQPGDKQPSNAASNGRGVERSDGLAAMRIKVRIDPITSLSVPPSLTRCVVSTVSV